MKNEKVKSNVPSLDIMANPIPTQAKLVEVPLHYHDELEFIPIYEGRFSIVVDDVCYVAEAGDVIFVNSGVPHRTFSDVPTINGLVQFRENSFISDSITKIVKYSAKLNNLLECKVRVLKNAEIFACLDLLINEAEKKEVAYEFFVRSQVYTLLGTLYRLGILSDLEQLYKSKELQKVLPAVEYINNNYKESVTLESMSAMLGFDPSYFCRIFKSATGATFTEYLNFVRVCKAERLLSRSDESILTISEAVGFSSVSYFNRVFKKIRNCSPKSYRATAYKNQ